MRLTSSDEWGADISVNVPMDADTEIKLASGKIVNVSTWDEGKKEAYTDFMDTYEKAMSGYIVCIMFVFMIAMGQWII